MLKPAVKAKPGFTIGHPYMHNVLAVWFVNLFTTELYHNKCLLFYCTNVIVKV